jgi:uncharacterized cupredoxin-like copper-binding protein
VHNNRLVSTTLVILAAVALGAATAACGSADESPGTTVRVELGNWYVEPSAQSAPAGRVTFRAVHVDDHGQHDGHGVEGGLVHELAVARLLADGSFEVVARVADLGPGQSRDLVVTLDAGEYELQCNFVEEVDGGVVAHYEKGMRASFTVAGG